MMGSDTFGELGPDSDTAPARLFFSINPPAIVIQHLSAIQSEVRRVLETGFDPRRAVRWIRPTQFHLTVLFLGNVPPAEIAGLEAFPLFIAPEYCGWVAVPMDCCNNCNLAF
jgi:LigT like Phosphoesterase